MHGIIHSGLKKYVETKHGQDVWNILLVKVGLQHKIYLTGGIYSDEEAKAIVAAASMMTGTPVDKILEDFGEFLAPDLMELYGSLVEPKWKTMDMLLNTEKTIHRVVRMRNSGAKPPKLSFTKTGENELSFYYNSERNMSSVAKGIIKGVAKYYGETVKIFQQKNPNGSCEMTIKVF